MMWLVPGILRWWGPTAIALWSTVPIHGEEAPDLYQAQLDVYQYEYTDFDRNPVHDEYRPAPCTGCLDERSVIDVAKVYLAQAGIEYLGEPAAEVLKDFPWRGSRGLRWWWSDLNEFGNRESVEYRGESGVARTASDTSDTAFEDLTWRVWYQTGWLSFDRIESRVDDGRLPLEALAWPPQRRASYFVVHARTGEMAMTHDVLIEDESEAFYRKHEEARAAAVNRAKALLKEDIERGDMLLRSEAQ